MDVIFEDKDLQELYEKGHNRKYRKYERDANFLRNLSDRIAYLITLDDTSQLPLYSFMHYEKLRGIGLSSIRVINGRKERLVFREKANGIRIVMIELNTTHYGSK